MKYTKSKTWITAGILLLGLVVILLLRQAKLEDHVISEEEAITIVKARYPELVDYPSDSLPPRTIRAEFNKNWYLAFVQNGSGRPIISARCYSVYSDGVVEEVGIYNPAPNPEGEALTISPISCR